MYQEHPSFRNPDNGDSAIIWRYMDFTKFISLLERKALFFVVASNLSEYDPCEGKFPRANLVGYYRNAFPKHKEETIMKLAEQGGIWQEESKHYNLINSWNLNQQESAAMWKVYLKSNEGIAIQSTFGHLKQSFLDPEECILIGVVDYHSVGSLGQSHNNTVEDHHIVGYIGEDENLIIPENAPNPYLCKRASFAYEQEIRAITYEFPSTEFCKDKEEAEERAKEIAAKYKIPVSDVHVDYDVAHHSFFGKYIDVDLDILIQKVYVEPTTPEWFKELVEQIMKKYDLGHKKVIKSSLMDDSLF